MAIRTMRGLKTWLRSELNKALLEDDIACDQEKENEIPYDIESDTIYQRIVWFQRALRAISFVPQNSSLNTAIDAIKNFIRRNPSIATETVREILRNKFPKEY